MSENEIHFPLSSCRDLMLSGGNLLTSIASHDVARKSGGGAKRVPVMSFADTRLPPHIDVEVAPDVSKEEIRAKIQKISASLPPLLLRRWNAVPLTQNVSDNRLRLMQFNVLAEGLSSGDSLRPPFDCQLDGQACKASTFGDFDAVEQPEICLDFKAVRRWRLLEEIIRINPDILSIEECDHFADFFLPGTNSKPRCIFTLNLQLPVHVQHYERKVMTVSSLQKESHLRRTSDIFQMASLYSGA